MASLRTVESTFRPLAQVDAGLLRLGARLRGRTATRLSKKGSEKVLGVASKSQLPSCDFEDNPKNRKRLAMFVAADEAKKSAIPGCEPICGHRGHCDFAMRFLCR